MWRYDYNGDPVSFVVKAQDRDGNPRYGLDTLIVIFTQVGYDSNSKQAAPPLLLHTAFTNKTAITRKDFATEDTRENIKAGERYFGQSQIIHWARESPAHRDGGSYKFSVGFGRSEHREESAARGI
eukprot:COSAG01_NODE_40235_length_466_cov_0.803815_1_plen_125_part_10